MDSLIRTLTDKRNTLVARERELLAAVTDDGMTPELRTNLDSLDVEFKSIQGDLERLMRAEDRGKTPRDPNRPLNDPGQRTDDAASYAAKVNGEFRKFALSDTRGEFSFKGREYRAAGLQADVDAQGGSLIPKEQFNAQLIEAVKNDLFIEAKAQVFNLVTAESLGTPSLDSFATNAVWGTELSIGVSDTGISFGRRSLSPHPLATYALISKKLLRASALPAEQIVRDNLAYAIGQPKEIAFINGDGANKPLGIFYPSALGASTSRDFTSASSSAFIGGLSSTSAGNDLIEVKYALKPQYWKNAEWLINVFHHKDIRKAVDSNGQYIWVPGGFGVGLSAGNLDSLLTHPVNMSQYAPVSTQFGSSMQTPSVTGSSGAITGRVAALYQPNKYWVANALDLSIEHLIEVRALQNQDVFIARVETDGMPVLAEAYSFLRLKGY